MVFKNHAYQNVIGLSAMLGVAGSLWLLIGLAGAIAFDLF